MEINKSKYEEILVQSEVVLNGRGLTNIPCRLYLPNKIGNTPILELRPSKKDFHIIARSHDVGLKAEVIGRDNVTEKAIESSELRLLECITRNWGHDLTESSIFAEPQHLRIVNNLRGHTPKKRTLVSFWISPNDFLSPLIFSSRSYTGTVENKKKNLYKKIINKGLALTFDKHFQYNDKNKMELRQWSNLVACAKINIPAENVDEFLSTVLPEVDNFLLVVSLATKRRTACIGWTASDGKTFTTYYRGNFKYPDFKKDGRIEDGLIEHQDFGQFVDITHASFMAFENKLALRNAIWAIVPSKETTIEESFLRLFAGLETLVLDFKRSKGMEYVLPLSKWAMVKENIKKHIGSCKELEMTSTQRGSMYKKLDELNRISLREAFAAFCIEYAINVEDLWPVFNLAGIAGLVEIRNKLTHGDPLPSKLFPSLMVAREHLRALVERVMVSVLGWDYEQTKVSPQHIEHTTYLIRDMPEAQKTFNDYLFR